MLYLTKTTPVTDLFLLKPAILHTVNKTNGDVAGAQGAGAGRGDPRATRQSPVTAATPLAIIASRNTRPPNASDVRKSMFDPQPAILKNSSELTLLLYSCLISLFRCTKLEAHEHVLNLRILINIRDDTLGLFGIYVLQKWSGQEFFGGNEVIQGSL
ncbi:unnamed protein product [Leptidea sinapis]|uniref:Uncharacterized protein n=1 Tax=Leptidea sinapis TaxID=189913 RepID=A0A5E4PY18_9NEOP|nr:unnamed protein product [Leptidea sinapis]